MSGKGKGFVWQDWLTAYQIAWYGLVELDAPVNIDNHHMRVGGGSDILRVEITPNEGPSPEEAFIKKEAYLSLSKEAKEVILLVLNSPQEILDCFITPKYNKISKEKIKQYLIENKKWKPKIVNRSFEELKRFSMEVL